MRTFNLFIPCLALLGLVITACQESEVKPQDQEVRYEVHDQTGQELIDQLIPHITQSMSDEQQGRLIEELDAALAAANQSDKVRAGLNRTASWNESSLSNGNPGDGFGQSVATTGNKVYVGARNDQTVYEFAKTGGTYTLINEVTPPGDAIDFGYQVSVSGEWMAVGAPAFFPAPEPAGEVFMFQKEDGVWTLKATLTGPADGANFGGDGLVLKGDKLAVTSRGLTILDGSTISIFELNGDNWSLSGSISQTGNTWFALDMNDAGTRIVATGSIGSSLGTVFASIFKSTGSAWSLEEQVIIPSPVPFGLAIPRDVAISNNTVVLTSIIPGNKFWVIKRTGGSWALDQEVTFTGGGPFSNRWTEIDGAKIIIGAASVNPLFPDAVFLFEQSGGDWVGTQTLTPSSGAADVIMWSVDLSGNTIVSGLPGLGGLTPLPGEAVVWE